jgi:predicted O-methyltransferase YrrM
MPHNDDLTPKSQPDSAVSMSFVIPYYRSLVSVYGELCNLNQGIAMLHPDVLTILYHLAQQARYVLELGPYIGGSTIAMAWGIRASNRDGRIVSVELGGAFGHPTMGTDNILRDLRSNLEKYEASRFVELVEGNSRDPAVVEKVRQSTPAAGYGLMFIDTDGEIYQDFELYRQTLSPRAYLVLDDYFAPGAPSKVGPTRAGIQRLIQAGLVECLGIYGWGTWVGRLTA